jgi:hypothetical protein
MKLLHTLAAVLAFTPAVVSAHHSFAAQYDGTRAITLTGTVVSVEWTNPHMHFSIDVKDANGAIAKWRFEGYPPNMLVRQGWKRDVTLKPGDVVTVFAWQARVEPNLAMSREVTFADGKKMTSGPPAGTGGN